MKSVKEIEVSLYFLRGGLVQFSFFKPLPPINIAFIFVVVIYVTKAVSFLTRKKVLTCTVRSLRKNRHHTLQMKRLHKPRAGFGQCPFWGSLMTDLTVKLSTFSWRELLARRQTLCSTYLQTPPSVTNLNSFASHTYTHLFNHS